MMRTSTHYKNVAEQCLDADLGRQKYGQKYEAISRNIRLASHLSNILLFDSFPDEDAPGVAKILQHAKKVSKLEMFCIYSGRRFNDVQQNYSYLKVFHDAIYAPPSLTTNTLANFHEFAFTPPRWCSLKHITPVFLLPKLRAFILERCERQEANNDWELGEKVSNIKVVKLDCCYMDSTIVAKMLASIKTLESFTCNLDPRGLIIPRPSTLVATESSP